MPVVKPTNVAAQRVLAIMDEVKEKLTYLSVVSPQVLQGLQTEEGDSTAQLLGSELVRKIADQIRLEELYQHNNTTADGTFSFAFDNEDARETVDRLQRNTRELCRRMRDVPNIVQELKNFQDVRPVNAMKLIHTFADMQEVMLIRMTTTVEEEKSRQELLEQYIQKEEAASKRRAQLEKELAEIRREREKVASSRSEIILKLKADLQDIQDSTKQNLRLLHEKYETRETQHREKFQELESGLNGHLSVLEAQTEQLIEKSREEEENLRKRKKLAEKEIERLTANYEQEMEETTSELIGVQKKCNEEMEELKELQSQMEKIDAEKSRIQEEKEVDKARQNFFDQASKRDEAAANLLQAFWKGIKQREEYVKIRKAANKRSGKGKKKKTKGQYKKP
eukprot:GHVQ01032700.1.p1 GENE.GHVQ01032700.1~~GHVQ01032700.1.p1  ORF type:complete len:395 (-),score=74.20 GHVQ01032700.1:1158-2342(-)